MPKVSNEIKKMSRKDSQTTKILKHLRSGKGITGLDALNLFGCFRLSARILELREQGYLIASRTIKKNGNSFSEYLLVEEVA